MAGFQGIEDFVGAVSGGGNGLEAAAYNASLDRLMRQRNQQALLDKRLEEATLAKSINTERATGLNAIPDPLMRGITGGNPGMGANYSAAQTGEGTRQQNEILQMALKALQGATEKGEKPPTDLLNALTAIQSGKIVGPGGVQVQEQAGAQIGKLNAETNYKNAQVSQVMPAQVGSYNATAEAARARTEQQAVTGENMEPLNALESNFLLQDPATLPVVTDTNWFSPNVTENLPMSDPRAQAEWAGMGKDARQAMTEDLGPEFMQWRATRLTTDPKMIDSTYAVTKFLQEKAGPANASGIPAAAAAPVAGQSATPASPTAPLRYVVGPDGSLVLVQ